MSGPKRYFVDTNIFLRILVKEDEKSFAECETFLNQVKSGFCRAVTSTLVIAEVAWVLGRLYSFSKPNVVRALRSISALKNLSIEDGHALSLGITLYERHSVKFVDAIIASHTALAEERLPIVSYDKDFDALGVKRILPGELV